MVGKSHPWFGCTEIPLTKLDQTDWVMRESGSGTQQMFEQALRNWGIDPTKLNVVLVLNSSEMVKAVVEGGVGAAAIPEVMVTKELQLSTLHAIKIVDIHKQGTQAFLEIVQPVLKLKHQQRFQTRLSIVFE